MSAMLVLALAMQVIQYPSPMYAPSDPRIQRMVYDPNQVVPLSVGKGYAAVIDLGADQVVESIVVGNRAGWEVTSSKRGDSVVVKPLEGASSTDMIVITEKRRYVFLIQAVEHSASFVLSFATPETGPVPLTASPPVRGAAATFRLSGAKALFPTDMHSDGQRTIISWSKSTALPAIFAVENGHESIVNGRMVGSDYVIEGTATRYIFRLGKDRAIATWQKPRPEK